MLWLKLIHVIKRDPGGYFMGYNVYHPNDENEMENISKTHEYAGT